MVNMGKIMKLIFILLSVISFASCALITDYSESSIIGLYEIKNRHCQGEKYELSACESIEFIEFVKGNFYKIFSDEVAFVVWSKSTDKNLLYAARKYRGSILFTENDEKIEIDKNEYIKFSNSLTGVYIFSGSSLEFKRVDRLAVTDYVISYPGSD